MVSGADDQDIFQSGTSEQESLYIFIYLKKSSLTMKGRNVAYIVLPLLP